MKVLISVGTLLALASAGASTTNLEQGVFIAHHPAALQFSTTPPPGGWCEEFLTSHSIGSCQEQVNRIDTFEPVLWFVLAAWEEEKEWCGTEFGFGEFGSGVFAFVDYGPCFPEDGLEIPTAHWPGPNEGTAFVTTGRAWRGNFRPVYYFAGYAYAEGVIPLSVDPPTDFGGTSNCQTPPEAWAAVGFGGMGLFRDGIYACPGEGIFGGQNFGPEGGGGILGGREPTVHYVCPDASANPDYTCIQTAIDSAAHGDTLELCCDSLFIGELNRNLVFGGKKLIIRSECDDPERCVIDCRGRDINPDRREARRGFVFDEMDTVSIRGLTIFDGQAYDAFG